MTAEVVELNVATRLDIPPERILRAAQDAGLAQTVIVGFDHDGDFFFSSSQGHIGESLLLLELAKKRLLELMDE